MAKEKANIMALSPFPYPAAQALDEISCYITDLSDVATSYIEIENHIRNAAQVHHQTSITLRASNGVIDRQSPEWAEISDGLTAAGYTVRVNNRTDTSEVFWG